MTLHLSTFDGGNALSRFRAASLLTALQGVHDKISAVSGRFVHWVATDGAPDAALNAQLAALLQYGEPYAGGSEGTLLLPWWMKERHIRQPKIQRHLS